MHYDRDMLYIAQMEKGEKLYHYTTIDALISIVSRKELWVTKWDYLNDIDEFRVALDVCAAVLKEEKIKPEVIRAVEKRVNESVHGDSLSNAYYIFSFSCDGDSQVLWSNYSNYDGINLEIDFAKFIKNLIFCKRKFKSLQKTCDLIICWALCLSYQSFKISGRKKQGGK